MVRQASQRENIVQKVEAQFQSFLIALDASVFGYCLE